MVLESEATMKAGEAIVILGFVFVGIPLLGLFAVAIEMLAVAIEILRGAL